MKIQKNLIRASQSWLNKPLHSGHLRPWLIDNGSLTMRLQQHYPHFSVKALAVKYAKPIQDEADLLHLPAYQVALIREVLLLGNHQPVIFAHSVLPRVSLRGSWHGLGKLGNKALGATLFANPQVQRTALRYKKLASHQLLYQLAVQHLAQKPPYLWARRSIFRLNCAKIMVTEVFLPAILESNTQQSNIASQENDIA